MSEPTPSPRPIVFCITELDPGGAERALVQIVTRLDRTVWQPTVICLSGPGEMCQPLTEAGIPVICLNARSRWQMTVLFRLVRELRRLRPVILQTFLFHANLLGRIAAWIAGVKVVISGIRVAERRAAWYLKVDRWSEFLVTRHVCVSRQVKEFSEQVAGLSSEKLVVIPNGVDVNCFEQADAIPRTELSVGAEDFLVLFVGRLDKQKGLSVLIEAAELLRPKCDSLKWLIVGAGPLQHSLAEQVHRAGLQEQVLFPGRRDDVPRLMKTADLFVLPSLWEGMPNVILEAMAAHLPVVSTAVEGVDDLLESGISAEIVPIKNPTALADAIYRMRDQPALRQEYARQAYNKVKENFSWEDVAARYAALYEGLLDPR